MDRRDAGDHACFDLGQRAQYAWEKYLAFKGDPGQRCADCWLLKKYCCCADASGIQLPVRVAVLMHHSELSRLRASNTAKLLLRFGAELLVWGFEDHSIRLREFLCEAEAPLVLFPAAGARPACQLLPEECPRARPSPLARPRCIVVLDGGWKETRKMNQSIDPRVIRCSLSSATRQEYGSTRKYGGDHNDRVQTAAAFIALLKELGEDAMSVATLQAELTRFTAAFERQIRWSGVILEARVKLQRQPCGLAVPQALAPSCPSTSCERDRTTGSEEGQS